MFVCRQTVVNPHIKNTVCRQRLSIHQSNVSCRQMVGNPPIKCFILENGCQCNNQLLLWRQTVIKLLIKEFVCRQTVVNPPIKCYMNANGCESNTELFYVDKQLSIRQSNVLCRKMVVNPPTKWLYVGKWLLIHQPNVLMWANGW